MRRRRNAFVLLLLLLLCILSTAAVVIDTSTTPTTDGHGCSETGPDVLEEPAPTSIQLILDWPSTSIQACPLGQLSFVPATIRSQFMRSFEVEVPAPAEGLWWGSTLPRASACVKQWFRDLVARQPLAQTPDEHVRFIIRVGQLMDIREFSPRMCPDQGARESDKERQLEMYQRIQRLCKRFVLIALVHARIDGPCYGLPPSAA